MAPVIYGQQLEILSRLDKCIEEMKKITLLLEETLKNYEIKFPNIYDRVFLIDYIADGWNQAAIFSNIIFELNRTTYLTTDNVSKITNDEFNAINVQWGLTLSLIQEYYKAFTDVLKRVTKQGISTLSTFELSFNNSKDILIQKNKIHLQTGGAKTKTKTKTTTQSKSKATAKKSKPKN